MRPKVNCTEKPSSMISGAEIDIMEANYKTDAYTTNIHWDGYQEHHKTSFGKVWTWNDQGKRTLLTDPIKYHNFGLKWTPDAIGNEYGKISGGSYFKNSTMMGKRKEE